MDVNPNGNASGSEHPHHSHWLKLKDLVSVESKFLHHVAFSNFTGEDLKFSDSSTENIIGCTLQQGIYELLSPSTPKKMIENNTSQTDKQFLINGISCEFSEVEGNLFSSIRQNLQVELVEYRASLGLPEGLNSKSTLRFVGSKAASGKSPSWFLFSPDMRYVCKTLLKHEITLLTKILPSFNHHISDFQKTLLPHFLGVYNVKVKNMQVCFVVMKNVFASFSPITERYDLKGSYAGRKASKKELEKGNLAVLKDLDLMERGRSINIANEAECQMLKSRISRDVGWLQSQNLLDYSLLVGFVSENDMKMDRREKSPFLVYALELKSACQFSCALVGIVDILTEFNWFKWLESTFIGSFRPGLSCKPPFEYGNRLIAFCELIIESSEENVPSKQQLHWPPSPFLSCSTCVQSDKPCDF